MSTNNCLVFDIDMILHIGVSVCKIILFIWIDQEKYEKYALVASIFAHFEPMCKKNEWKFAGMEKK